MACANCGGDHETPEGENPDIAFILRTSGDAMLFLSQNHDVAERFSRWIQDSGKADMNFIEYDREMFLTNLATVHEWAHAYADDYENTRRMLKLVQDAVNSEERLNDAPITEYMEGPE